MRIKTTKTSVKRGGGVKAKANGLTFLSLDPGCRNTGWSVSTMTPSGKLRVIRHGVFLHDYCPEENAVFVKSILESNFIVLVEDPPVVRVNASTSHVLAKIYGAIWGVVSTSDVVSYERIPPKSWQHSLLREHFETAKREGQSLTAKQREFLLREIVNKNITRRRPILNPHVIDTLAMVLYYCRKNGSELESVMLSEAVQKAKYKTKRVRRKKVLEFDYDSTMREEAIASLEDS